MGIEWITLIAFSGLILILVLGVPVGFGLAGYSLVLISIFLGPDLLFTVAATTYQQITSMNIMAIPQFVIMANLLVHSGVSDRLYAALGYWLYGIKGSLAVITIGVCVALAMTAGWYVSLNAFIS